jgi:proteasome accessory factor C
MSRPAAHERLQRLLVMVPWVMQQDGPTVTEVCERFGMSEKELAADLEMLFLCGLYPFTPDTLIEADIYDGRVYIRYADAFDRPPMFSPEEAVSLMAAASTVAVLPGNEGNEALQSALRKLSGAMGLEDGAVDIRLTSPGAGTLGQVQRATDEHRVIETDYYSWGRDALTRRRLEPHRVFNTEGQWYVFAKAPGDTSVKTFRVDRMQDVRITDDTFLPLDQLPEPSAFAPQESDPVVELDLDATARWVVSQYPVESAQEQADGSVRVVLRVSEQPWIERLLLRLGQHARVVAGEASTADAARGVLSRYEA